MRIMGVPKSPGFSNPEHRSILPLDLGYENIPYHGLRLVVTAPPPSFFSLFGYSIAVFLIQIPFY